MNPSKTWKAKFLGHLKTCTGTALCVAKRTSERYGIYTSSVENKTTTVGMLVKFMLNTNSIIGECTALNKFQLHICSG